MTPSLRRCLLRDRLPLGWGKRRRPRLAALQTPKPSQRRSAILRRWEGRCHPRLKRRPQQRQRPLIHVLNRSRPLRPCRFHVSGKGLLMLGCGFAENPRRDLIRVRLLSVCHAGIVRKCFGGREFQSIPVPRGGSFGGLALLPLFSLAPQPQPLTQNVRHQRPARYRHGQ